MPGYKVSKDPMCGPSAQPTTPLLLQQGWPQRPASPTFAPRLSRPQRCEKHGVHASKPLCALNTHKSCFGVMNKCTFISHRSQLWALSSAFWPDITTVQKKINIMFALILKWTLIWFWDSSSVRDDSDRSQASTCSVRPLDQMAFLWAWFQTCTTICSADLCLGFKQRNSDRFQ